MRLDELTHSRVGVNVSTIDRSSPFIKQQMKKGADRKKAVNSAESVKDKFEYILNITKKSSSTKIRLGDFTQSNIKNYDSSTGQITIEKSAGKQTNVYSANINDYNYDGREKSLSSLITYKFSSNVSPKLIDSKKNDKFDNVGKNTGKKSSISRDVFKAW